MTIGKMIRIGVEALSSKDCNARLEAEILLSQACGKSKTFLLSHDDYILDTDSMRRFSTILRKRVEGTPIAYLTGKREFWSIDFSVSPDTLIPRPETECLVDHVLDALPIDQPACIADLGTGCGAIAIAIAKERPNCNVVATDLSNAALRVATHNVRRHSLNNVHFWLGNWADAIAEDSLDMVVSNPPYISPSDPHLKRGDLRFEPTLALCAPKQGFAHIERLCATAKNCLIDGGMLAIEHGASQRSQTITTFKRHGYVDIQTQNDLAGMARVISGRIRH